MIWYSDPLCTNLKFFISRSSSCLQNHYEVLGIQRNATGKEIKDAYLKLSKEVTINTETSRGGLVGL